MKVFEGIVVSNQMTNTVVVEVFRVKPHPLYKKLVKLSKKYKADTSGLDEITVGSVVRITETKPVSKDKYFKVSKIVSKGEGLALAQNEEKVEEILKKPTEKPAVKSTMRRVKKAKDAEGGK